MQILCTDSLVKIFPETKRVERLKSATALLSDEYHLQLFIRADEMLRELTIEASHGSAVTIYAEDYILGLTCNMKGADSYTVGKPGAFPDLLREPSSTDFFIRPEMPCTAFVCIDCGKLGPGKHRVTFALKNGGEVLGKAGFTLEVIDATAAADDLIITNWLHCDCLSDFYRVRPWTNRFFEIVENFVGTAVKNGINTVFVPCFTPPLDTFRGGHRTNTQLIGITKDGDGYHFDFQWFDRFIRMAQRCGVRYFEINHLFTQWGAEYCPDIYIKTNGRKRLYFSDKVRADSREYREFLSDFLPCLRERLDFFGIREQTLWHLSDEPNKEHLPLYQKHRAFFKTILPEGVVIDALSDHAFQGMVDIPVVAMDAVDPFLDAHEKIMVYCCTGQDRHFEPNRFFSIPPERHRVLGVMLYKTGACGFLHWGYNFYNAYLSKKHIHPYWQSDSAGRFQAGDAFIVYPGEGGRTEASVRLKTFQEAMADYRALKLLEGKRGRDFVTGFLEQNGYVSFSEYPHDRQKLLGIRDEVNRMIGEGR